jgi:alcohol dehydrogenase (cytochrome c)
MRQTDMKIKALAGLLLAMSCGLGAAQSIADLRNDAATPGDVTTYGMGWGQQRHTPLMSVTPANVKRLVPVWNYSLDNSANASSQPLLIDGTMYIASHTHTMAVDAATGRQKWRTPIEVPADVAGFLCCGIHSRGLAALDGVLYRTTIDAHVVAISMKDGKQIWKVKAADYKQGYSMTHAPLIAGGVLITGISGGEYGTRGFINGWDLKTGEKKWTRFTTALPNEKGGDTWKPGMAETGGGPTWLTGTYDPELDLVYWGTGNGGPWNPAMRGGDSLYICSVLAIRPSTGEVVWHFQFSPGDPYDYDGTNELVLAELPVGGKPTKVLMQANRNGYFYVIDRSSGKFISGTQFAKKVNWASGIDANGRPIDTPMTAAVRKTEQQTDFIEVWPSAFGGKNWMPMSYDPTRRLAFFNTVNLGMKVKYVTQTRPGGPNWWLGLELGGFEAPADGMRGSLVAWDPVAGKQVWEVPLKTPNWSGVLSTASGLVFVGTQTGQFKAYDAANGKELWSFQTGSGITGLPIAWEHNGRQYITVTSGAATVYAALAGDPELANVPAGGSVWTFALMP